MEVYNVILLVALGISFVYIILQALMLDALQKTIEEDTPPFQRHAQPGLDKGPELWSAPGTLDRFQLRQLRSFPKMSQVCGKVFV